MNTKTQNKMNLSECEKLFRKSFVFVLDVIRFNELLKEKNKHSIAEKLLFEATNFGEHILTLKSSKERYLASRYYSNAIMSAQKTKYLLQLCKYSENYPNPNQLLKDVECLIKEISN